MAAPIANGGGQQQEAVVSISKGEIAADDKSSKKYAVYKVIVSSRGKNWFIFRRYSEFQALYDMLKKKYPEAGLKLPGKRLFGNNLDLVFIKQRCEGLDTFIQKIMGSSKMSELPEVREFLCLDSPRGGAAQDDDEDVNDIAEPTGDNDGNDGDDEKYNLGNTEKSVKPSEFEFLKVIGKGSFGKVLLAKHKDEEKLYAIKVLQKKAIMKRNEVKHIMAERNVLLQNLKHPFLVGLHYSFQTTDKLYFVLSYLNGGELFFHLQRERYFTEPRARFYAAEIASAIGYLHSHDIIYRDLKPENILLDSDGHVVLTDFGLCKEAISAETTTSTFCGTPEYLAPEVLKKQEYTRSVDWWCLGAVLYEMCYGLPPFYSRDTSEMYDNILHKPLRLRSTISSHGRDILQGLLQKDRTERLGSQRDFDEIRSHAFFTSVNWDLLNQRKMRPPYNPDVRGDLDTSKFDPEFVREPVPASIARTHEGKIPISASVQEADQAFCGFSYVKPFGEDIKW